ncbi:MurR/RpiR family transcriptional regulator [Mesomycoplasma neurolyticum]|uniref:GntR family transcriptional regulator n=1 Tax=Mesomycoplasma neurolyticum TaxID=2120 RepID=A0A449A530_9BACT|nr:SIS domain-containing protein [Mesomycoplasma neurolyticum]VEU59348.1 GntR family transcriptional regulator [Mesomycoplasma neurolyticum]
MYLFLNKKKSFTKTEVEILDFINSWENKDFDLTIQELSKKLFVSTATISRFAKKMNFKTYKELVFFVNKRIAQINIIYNKKNNFIDKEFSDLFISQKLVIDSFIKEKNFANIKDAANLIDKAEKILLLGLGTSGLILQEFYSNIRKIGKNVIFDQNFHILLPLVGTLSENDVILCLTKDFENKEVIFTLEKAKKLNIKIIIIVSDSKKTFNFGNVKISYTKIQNKNKLFPASSKVIGLIILDFLFNFLLSLNQKYRKNLKKGYEILDEWILKK